MRVKFFAIPALDPERAEAELNAFLAQHRSLSIDREIVTEKNGSFWAVSVTFLERAKDPNSLPSKGRVDYKEVLSPRDFEIYAALRELRKELAEREGVPPYAIFNNAQLAEMVQKRVQSSEDLGQISGVGPSRIAAHGPRFLERLAELTPNDSAEDRRPEANDD